jgi:hypothetical protein
MILMKSSLHGTRLLGRVDEEREAELESWRRRCCMLSRVTKSESRTQGRRVSPFLIVLFVACLLVLFVACLLVLFVACLLVLFVACLLVLLWLACLLVLFVACLLACFICGLLACLFYFWLKPVESRGARHARSRGRKGEKKKCQF